MSAIADRVPKAAVREATPLRTFTIGQDSRAYTSRSPAELNDMRIWISAFALLGTQETNAMDENLLPKIYWSPEAFENKVVSICSRRPIDGQTIMVGNMGRSPTVIWLDRPIKSPSGCVRAKLIRADNPSADPRLADGPIALAGWRLKVLRIL